MTSRHTRTIALLAGLAAVVVAVAVGLNWREIYYAFRPEARFWGRWTVEGGEDQQIRDVEGIVEAVNDEERLLVLSMGRDQNLKPGNTFFILRGMRYIGRVEVIRAYDGLSGARVLHAAPGDRVKVGDSVSTDSALTIEFYSDGEVGFHFRSPSDGSNFPPPLLGYSVVGGRIVFSEDVAFPGSDGDRGQLASMILEDTLASGTSSVTARYRFEMGERLIIECENDGAFLGEMKTLTLRRLPESGDADD